MVMVQIQFCFRDNEGRWDNNNAQNYILPVCEKEEENVLTFEPVLESSTEVTLDVVSESENTVDDYAELFEPEIIEINEIDLYKTVDLEETAKQTIPNNTLFTQVNLEEDEPEKAFSDAVIQAPTVVQNVSIDYAKLEEEAKAKALQPETPEVANPDVKDVPKKVENIEDSKALVSSHQNDLDYVPTSFFGSIVNGVKTAFSKVIKLVKSAFDFGENED